MLLMYEKLLHSFSKNLLVAQAFYGISSTNIAGLVIFVPSASPMQIKKMAPVKKVGLFR